MRYKLLSTSVSSLEAEYYDAVNAIAWDSFDPPALALEIKTEQLLDQTFHEFFTLTGSSQPEKLDPAELNRIKQAYKEAHPEMEALCSSSKVSTSIPDIVRVVAYSAFFKESPLEEYSKPVHLKYDNSEDAIAGWTDLKELSRGCTFNVMPGVTVRVSEEGKLGLDQEENRDPISAEDAKIFLSNVRRFKPDHPLKAVSVLVSPTTPSSSPSPPLLPDPESGKMQKNAPVTKMIEGLDDFVSHYDADEYEGQFLSMLREALNVKGAMNELQLHHAVLDFLAEQGCTLDTWYKAAVFRVFNGELSVHLPSELHHTLVTERTEPFKTKTGESVHIYGCSVGGEIGIGLANKGRFSTQGGEMSYYDPKKLASGTNFNRITGSASNFGKPKTFIRAYQTAEAHPSHTIHADTNGFTIGSYLEKVLVPLFRGGQRQFVFNEMDNPSARAALQLVNGLGIQAQYRLRRETLPVVEAGVADNTGSKPTGRPMLYTMFPSEFTRQEELLTDIGEKKAVLFNPSLLGLMREEGWYNVATGKVGLPALINTVGGRDRLSEELKTSLGEIEQGKKSGVSQPPEVVGFAARDALAFMRLLLNTLDEEGIEERLRSGYTWDGEDGFAAMLHKKELRSWDQTKLLSKSKDPSDSLEFFSFKKEKDEEKKGLAGEQVVSSGTLATSLTKSPASAVSELGPSRFSGGINQTQLTQPARKRFYSDGHKDEILQSFDFLANKRTQLDAGQKRQMAQRRPSNQSSVTYTGGRPSRTLHGSELSSVLTVERKSLEPRPRKRGDHRASTASLTTDTGLSKLGKAGKRIISVPIQVAG